METRTIYEIDGAAFRDLEGFLGRGLADALPGARWGRNLDAFNDILRGGFGTPAGGFVLRWSRSERSRKVLGYEATARWLERKLRRCHPDNTASVRAELEAAQAGRGPTLFDIRVEIIEVHGAGGEEEEDGVELRLE